DGVRYFESLLKGSERLGRALLVYPCAVSGIDIEYLRRNRRDRPPVPSRECPLDLRFSLLGRKSIVQRLTALRNKCVNIDQRANLDWQLVGSPSHNAPTVRVAAQHDVRDIPPT